jgi:hypothetical protein
MVAATGFAAWALGAVVLGAGTAMVYPTLLAAISDVAHPAWRARSVGVYRLWRAPCRSWQGEARNIDQPGRPGSREEARPWWSSAGCHPWPVTQGATSNRS